MSFINGLKDFFRKPLYVIILISFIISWFLIIFGRTLTSVPQFFQFLFVFIGILVGFNVLLLTISLFKPIEKLPNYIILIVFAISVPTVIIFKGFLILFSLVCLIANQLLTIFFAFKLCMDSSTKFDDILYKNEKYNTYSRIIEFICFGLLTGLIFIFTWNYFGNKFPVAARNSANIFRIVFWVNVILIVIVIARLVVVKKFAAYITLFFVLTFFYILYIIIDLIAEAIFPDTIGFEWTSFLIDLFLFIYIIGSVFDKIEYLENKFKIVRAETLSIFVILMKLIAQFTKVFPNFQGLDVPLVDKLDVFILIIFILFTLFFGIHSIIAHREGKNEIETTEND
ncbi:MAG: hypothetical protein KGD65_08075 [Candidatus Lokiarchaeota archaeon]|nr:hypothetical protein [Candidatus Lokiarchaeota archaeon]